MEETAVPVSAGLVEIGTAFLFMLTEGKAATAQTTFQLWPLARHPG